MRLTETMKCRASSPCLNCVGWQDISLTEDRASSPCLDCVGWQDMRLVSGRASSPCLNCMGWQDTSLTVAKEDRASSPYLNCVGWQDKSSSRWSFPMSGGMASSPYLNCVGWQDKLTVEVMNHNALWTASAPFQCCQTDLILVLLRHGRLVDRIEENQKNSHSGGVVGFQVPSYYDTVLYNNSRLL